MVVDYKSRKNEVLESYEKLEALISDLHEYLKKIELPDPIEHLEVLLRDIRSKAEKVKEPIELHHLGQKADSPLVELTEEEHRTGEYEDGKKNQSLWHDNTVETEVHGEGNNWDQERKTHWKARATQA